MTSDNGMACPLLTLPVELLQAVAQQCTCKSLINLMLVNRQFHAICNDRLVLRYVAENGHKSTSKSSSEWTAAASILDKICPADTLRIAFAAEKATAIARSVQNDLRGASYYTGCPRMTSYQDFYKWLPHLIAMRHPICDEINPLYFLNCLEPVRATRPHPTEIPTWLQSEIIFSLTARTLVEACKCDIDRLLDDYSDFVVAAGYTPEHEHARLPLFFDEIAPTIKMVADVHRIHGDVAVLVILSLALQAGAVAGTLLPSIDKMNFPSLMEWVPQAVYRQYSKIAFENMWTPQFLAGEWIGYYSDHWGYLGRSFTLDPPMHTIRIDTSQATNTDQNPGDICIEETSEGHDAHGHFRLSGSISRAGRVFMAKQYTGHPCRWSWVGKLTPFGVAGAWGNRRFGGYFWIWKKEWI